MAQTFADRLDQLRKKAKLRWAELARRADLSLHSLSCYSTERSSPRLEALLRLASALGVSLSAFDGVTTKPDGRMQRRKKHPEVSPVPPEKLESIPEVVLGR